ncbi:hypothetical protein RYX36_035710 [Vicia faba]
MLLFFIKKSIMILLQNRNSNKLPLSHFHSSITITKSVRGWQNFFPERSPSSSPLTSLILSPFSIIITTNSRLTLPSTRTNSLSLSTNVSLLSFLSQRTGFYSHTSHHLQSKSSFSFLRHLQRIRSSPCLSLRTENFACVYSTVKCIVAVSTFSFSSSIYGE